MMPTPYELYAPYLADLFYVSDYRGVIPAFRNTHKDKISGRKARKRKAKRNRSKISKRK